jgi:hypothetical protein
MPDSTTLAAILAFVTAAIGMFLGFPIFLGHIKDRQRQKRQQAVREIIRRRGVATRTDMMRDGLKDADAGKAISEMYESGEIVPSVTGEVSLWRFNIHDQQSERRLA